MNKQDRQKIAPMRKDKKNELVAELLKALNQIIVVEESNLKEFINHDVILIAKKAIAKAKNI